MDDTFFRKIKIYCEIHFVTVLMDSKTIVASVAETKEQIDKYFYRIEVIERNLAFQGNN